MAEQQTPPKPRRGESSEEDLVADCSPPRRLRLRTEPSVSPYSRSALAAGERIKKEIKSRRAPSPRINSEEDSDSEDTHLTEASRRELELWVENRIRELWEKKYSAAEITSALEKAQEKIFGGVDER